MLQGINKLGRSWVGRVLVAVLFGFLIVSFAIWGIGDIFRGNVRTQVATVGGQDISADAFRSAYQTEYQNLIRRARGSVTPEQARALGLDSRVLGRLVSEAAIDQEARRLGLAASDQLVVEAIQGDPTFRGPSGAFDRLAFNQILAQSGLSEAQFVREQRAVLARQQLAEAVSGAVQPPLALREAVHRYATERRSAEFLVLGPGILGEIPAPTEAQLQSFYDDRKASYRAPEYRSANLLVLDASALAKPEAVSEADARAFYERVKDSRFGQPERRAIQQVVFASAAEAEQAAERIKAGTPLETIAAERGITPEALNLGTFTKAEMFDPAVAEAAFGLAEGATSGPIEGRFGPVLVRAASVQPAALKPFEEVAGDVRRELALERARTELEGVHDAIEDARAGAKPLAEIARDRGLALTTLADIDRTGRDKAGAEPAPLPARAAVLAALFRSDVGADTEAVRVPEGGYVWLEVTGVEPARDRPLAEVADRVRDDWRRAEIAQRLADRARELAERLNKGETVGALAAELGLPAQTATDLRRGVASPPLDAAAVTRIFATPVGQAASAPGGEDGRVLFRVTNATVPPFVTTTQEAAEQENRLQALLSDDLLSQYVTGIEKRVGVETFPANVRRAIGGEF